MSSGTPKPELQLMQVEMQSPNIWNADFIISCYLDEVNTLKKLKMARFEPGIFTFKLKDFTWSVLKLRFSVPSQKMMLSVRFEPWIFGFKLLGFIFHPYPEFSYLDLEKMTILRGR